MAKDVLDKIFDLYVSHSIDLIRLEEDLRIKISGSLKQLSEELIEQLYLIDPTAPTRSRYRLKRALKLFEQTNNTINSEYKELKAYHENYLKDLSVAENVINPQILNEAINVSIFSQAFTPGQAKRIASNLMIQGAVNKDWWSRMATKTQNAFADQVRLGMFAGESLGDITQRIRGKATGKYKTYFLKDGQKRRWMEFKGGVMDISTREAQALARTSIHTVANQIRLDTFEKNKELIRGKTQLSVLDSKTTPHCQAYDQLSFDLENKPIGHSYIYVPLPAHFGCRSGWIPYLRPLSEISKGKLRDMPESSRAAFGKPVPAKTDYSVWFKDQSIKKQVEILGPGKHKIWKKYGLDFRDLVDQKGNPLTISELKLKYKIKD